MMKNVYLFSFCLFALLSCTCLTVFSKEYKLWYLSPAPNRGGYPEDKDWETYSLPIGNGYMGASVFGRTDTERVQLTEKTLCNKGLYGIGGLTNFAELYLDFNHSVVENYYRDLNIENATASVAYLHNGVRYSRTYFMSYPDNVMVIKLCADRRKSISFTLRPQLPYLHENGSDNNGRSGLVTARGDLITFSGFMNYFSINYEGQVKVLAKGGNVQAANDERGSGTIRVKNADEVTLLVALGTNYELSPELFMQNENARKLNPQKFPHQKVSETIKKASLKGYEKLLQTHTADYRNLYARVSLNLNDSYSELPTDSLLHEYKRGKENNYLEELLFQYGRYLLIASSREHTQPCGLQGVWTQYEETPWTGGYWHNINIQMNYWPAFNTNLAETFEPYVRYNEAFRRQASLLATDYIKQNNPQALGEDNGWTIGTAATPYFIGAPGIHSGPGTGGLTTKLFWDYYEFTQDTTFLREVAFPAIRGMSTFLSKVVKPTKEGWLLATPSASAEQVKTNTSAWNDYYISVGTTFDQGFIWENHADLLKGARIVGDNDPFLKLVAEQMKKLDPIQIGLSGQIKEYREENYYGEIGEWEHRHISQLCPLYPGTLINSSTPEWLEAAKVTLDRRGDRSTGWAMAHRMNARARTKEGNAAYNLYRKMFVDNRTLENLWMIHPPFQIDASCGATAGIAEMLLQSHEGCIEPLPALPFVWRKGEYTGLVARGNFEVSAKWADGHITHLDILSKSGGICKVKYPGIERAAVRNSANQPVGYTKLEDGLISFATDKSERYHISMGLDNDLPPSIKSLRSTPAELEKKMRWFDNARFGMFVHWGVYSMLGGTWDGKKYGGYGEHIQRMAQIPIPVYREKVAGTFNPTLYSAKEWVSLAKEAGMKYIIITSKHHDGFAMYDSKVSDYTIVKATPYKKDPLLELKNECDKAGVKFGVYYSHAFDWGEENAPGNDWDYNNPGGDKLLNGSNWWENDPEFLKKAHRYVTEKSIPQLLELIERYHPAIIWFDTAHKLPTSENLRIMAAVRKADPTIIINGRCIYGEGDYDSTWDCPVDFHAMKRYWEGVPTTNDSYAYNANDLNHKPASHFIQLLVKAAARGGNILMNIGPKGDGAIDERDANILKGIGQWWTVNGEQSVRGTQSSPLDVQSWGESTSKGDTLYLHVFQWPKNGKLLVGGVNGVARKAYLLSDKRKNLKWKHIDGDLEINLPAVAPDSIDAVIAVVCSDLSKITKRRLLSTDLASDKFRTFDAQLSGGLQYGDEHIGCLWVHNWKKKDASITWKVSSTEPVSFDLSINYAARKADNPGGRYTVTIGANKMVKEVRQGDTVTDNLGRITLPQGDYEMSITCESLTGAELFRPRHIILNPVQ